MSATKRWIFRIGDLTNHTRAIQPGVTIVKRSGNGVLPVPPIKRRHKRYTGRAATDGGR